MKHLWNFSWCRFAEQSGLPSHDRSRDCITDVLTRSQHKQVQYSQLDYPAVSPAIWLLHKLLDPGNCQEKRLEEGGRLCVWTKWEQLCVPGGIESRILDSFRSVELAKQPGLHLCRASGVLSQALQKIKLLHTHTHRSVKSSSLALLLPVADRCHITLSL